MTRLTTTVQAVTLAPGHHASRDAGRDPFSLADVFPVASVLTSPSHSVTSSSATGPALTARAGRAGLPGPPPAPGMVTSPPRSWSAMPVKPPRRSAYGAVRTARYSAAHDGRPF